MAQKAAGAEWGPEQEQALQQVPAATQAALPLGSLDPAGPSVLGVAVADRGAVWGLWWVPTSKLQCKPLGFGGKALLPSADNYCPFEKQFLACYQAWVETECLAVGRHVPM